MLFNIVLLCFLVGYIENKELPPYIKGCKKDDPHINTCAKNSANEAIRNIFKGDANYHYPKLDPLKLDSVEFIPDHNLSLQFKDITIEGLKTAKVNDMKVDLKKRIVETELEIPWIQITCQYVVEGYLLHMPVKGNGPAFIKLEGVNVHRKTHFNLTIKDDGLQYIDPHFTATVQFKLKHATIQFDNMFDDDKAAGDMVNRFLNQNYKTIAEEFHIPISAAIDTIATHIMKPFLEIVPYDEFFPN